MENEETLPGELSMYDRNMLQFSVAEKVAAQLGMTTEDILLEHSGDLGELIQATPNIAHEVLSDREALVERFATALLEQHRGRHAA